MHDPEHEALIASLRDPEALRAYKEPCDHYTPRALPRILGRGLVGLGNLFYGKNPSYEKFKAIEVIARIPYQSFEVASYTFLTAFYSNERKAIELSRLFPFSRVAQDNETMHVVVLSQIVQRTHGNHFFRHTLVPLIFAFFYFWIIFFLYLVRPRAALELNYVFEDHAYEQYNQFLLVEGEWLKRRPVMSDFLVFYGRNVRNEYELFESIRNDELVHRNRSLRKVRELESEREREALERKRKFPSVAASIEREREKSK